MKLSEINKAITAAATALAGMEGVVAFLNADTTHPWVHVIAVGFSAAVGAATWIVKNKAEIEDYVERIDGVAVPAPSAPVPAPAPAAPLPAVIQPAPVQIGVPDAVELAIERYKKIH